MNYINYHGFLNASKGVSLSISTMILLLVAVFPVCSSAQNTAKTNSDNSLFYDSHFHLTNYIQEGIDIHKFLQVMGTKVGRSTLFGIPLQQEWAYENSGDFAPTYY